MSSDRIRRIVGRGVAVLALGCAATLGAAFLQAPSAGAAPTATVEIKDLTPPLVSIDKNGVVTFVNEIADKPVQVQVGPLSVVDAVVHTDVTLGIPDVQHPIPLQPGQKVDQKFAQSCLTCTITYSYRAEVPNGSVVGSVLGTVTSKAVASLPQTQTVTYDNQQTVVQIGVPTPFLVNTLVPLPNLPSINLPALPKVDVPLPNVTIPTPSLPSVPGGTTSITRTTTTTTTRQGLDGANYAYDVGGAGHQLDPLGGGAPAFDSSRMAKTDGASSAGPDSGAGGLPGSRDGASSGTSAGSAQLAGLDATQLASASTPAQPRADDRAALTLPALAAIVALVGVFAALVRTSQAARARRR